MPAIFLLFPQFFTIIIIIIIIIIFSTIFSLAISPHESEMEDDCIIIFFCNWGILLIDWFVHHSDIFLNLILIVHITWHTRGGCQKIKLKNLDMEENSEKKVDSIFIMEREGNFKILTSSVKMQNKKKRICAPCETFKEWLGLYSITILAPPPPGGK